MLKYLEYHKNIYTGYHTYAKSHEYIQKYKHIMYNSLEERSRSSDPSVYTYRIEVSNICSAVGTSSEFLNCLKYCNLNSNKTCEVSLNRDITLVDYNYNRYFSNLNVQIRNNDDNIHTLELSNAIIHFNRLDISGVNLNVHDVSKGFSPITIQDTLIIQEGSHNFYNNYTDNSGGGGAIYSRRDIHFIDTCINFINNYAFNSGGAIITDNAIFTDSIIHFMDNNSSLNGGAINSVKIFVTDSSITFSNNHAKYGDGGAIYFHEGDISFIDSSITFIDNYSISGDGGAILHNSGEMIFAGGLYEFYNNKLLDLNKHGSAIGGDKILIDNSSQKTTLHFIDNSGKSTIWINNFDTSLACSEPNVTIPGCNNIYNFTHNLVNTGIFSFKDNLFMAGGSWDFSNNTYGNKKSTTALYGNNIATSKIHLRYADFSFDNTLVTVNATSDVSNIGKTKGTRATSEEKYYNYSIFHTSEFNGHAAIEISTNRYN